MQDNTTAEGRFLGTFSIAMIVLWIAGAALLMLAASLGAGSATTAPAAVPAETAPAPAQ